MTRGKLAEYIEKVRTNSPPSNKELTVIIEEILVLLESRSSPESSRSSNQKGEKEN